MRRSYAYAVQIHGLDIEGRYVADCGHLDTLDLPDHTTVAINLDGSTINEGQGQDALTLARLIARRIMNCVHHQADMDQTRPYQSWAAHAPELV